MTNMINMTNMNEMTEMTEIAEMTNMTSVTCDMFPTPFSKEKRVREYKIWLSSLAQEEKYFLNSVPHRSFSTPDPTCHMSQPQLGGAFALRR